MNRNIINIQVLRAIAALMVAYFHAQPMVDAAYGAHAPVYMGSFGVDLFFVISGFIMYYNISQNEFSFKNFFA